MPVDQYIGGVEHAIMHLLYARFYTKMLRDFGILKVDEPFENLLTQGMVCKETMRCKKHGYLYPDEVKDGKCSHCNGVVTIGKMEKMSKSLKNVVDPDYLIEEYGADTARLFCLFASPPEKDLEWSDRGVDGSFRFLGRVWRIVMDYLDDIKDIEPFDGKDELESDLKNLRRKTHQTIKRVTNDIEERFHFNTAISAVMELVNTLYQVKHPDSSDGKALSVIREAVENIIILLAPIVPHITEELWEMLGQSGNLSGVPWPCYDESVAAEEEITIVVQINGKLRSRIVVSADESDGKIKKLALSDEKIDKLIASKEVVKEIYIPKKLVNIVVK
jgi:leucyl-tRNA synthetase